MEIEEYIKYFNDTTKIYAICSDLNIPDEKIRLLTFIHIKICENGLEYLEHPRIEEVQALQIMLGDSDKIIQTLKEENLNEEQKQSINESIQVLANHLVKADNELSQQCGLENRLSSELKYRLLLFENSKFRKEMLDLYQTQIEPKILLYDNQKIKEAFENYQIKTIKKEQELKQLLGFSDPRD